MTFCQRFVESSLPIWCRFQYVEKSRVSPSFAVLVVLLGADSHRFIDFLRIERSLNVI